MQALIGVRGARREGRVAVHWPAGRTLPRRSRLRPGLSAALVRLLVIGVALFAALCGGGSARGADVDSAAPSDAARIDVPADGATVSGLVEVRGRAAMSDPARFSFYRVVIGRGRTPSQMRPLDSPHDQPVDGGVLTTWDVTRYPPGEYRLGLAVYDRDGNVASTSVLVTVAAQPTPTPFVTVGAPVIVVPAVAPAPVQPASAPPVDPGLTDPSLVNPQPALPLNLPTPFVPELAPIPNIAPASGTGPYSPPTLEPLPSDPVQPDPLTNDLVPIN